MADEKIAAQAGAPTRGQLRALLPILLSMLVMLIVGVSVSAELAHRAEVKAEQSDARELHVFCPLLTVLDGAYRAIPPTTPTGRIVAADMHELVVEYGCEPS